MRLTTTVVLLALLFLPAASASTVTFMPDDVPLAPSRTDSGEAARARLESTVAIDPTNTSRVLAGAMDFNWGESPPVWGSRGTYGPGVYRSEDGGRTWETAGFAPMVDDEGRPCDRGQGQGADPSVVYDADGTAYYSWLGGCGSGGAWVATTRDLGRTWSQAVRVASQQELEGGFCAGPDKQLLATDRPRGIVYLTWTAFGAECETGANDGGRIYVARSHDDGVTWTEPSWVDATLKGHAAFPQVAPDGTLHVVYTTPSDNECPPSVAFTVNEKRPIGMAIVHARSTDQGESWSDATVVAEICDTSYWSLNQPFAWRETVGNLPALTIDPSDETLYATWAHQEDDVVVQASVSTDQGATWTPAPVPHRAGNAEFMPAIVARDGQVHLVYMSEEVDGHYDALYTRSDDHGATWAEPVALNSGDPCACDSWLRNGPMRLQPWLGHYNGIDLEGGLFVPLWSDARDTDGGQTMYTRVADVARASGAPDAIAGDQADAAVPASSLLAVILAGFFAIHPWRRRERRRR